MSDIVEDVARGLYTDRNRRFPDAPSFEDCPGHYQQRYREHAEAAIAAARPHIRAEVFDELIAETKNERNTPAFILERLGADLLAFDRHWDQVGSWLRARKESE